MANTTRSGLDAAKPMFDIEADDAEKINPYMIQSDPKLNDQFAEYQEARKDLITSLQNRYLQPNWLAVSAQFAKPQLGGFGASWGSAMGELGAQEENRRAMQPTIAKMRAENSRNFLMLGQKAKAAEMAEAAAKKGVVAPGVAGDITGLTSGPAGVAKAITEQEGAAIQQFVNKVQMAGSVAKARIDYGDEYVDKFLKPALALYGPQLQNLPDIPKSEVTPKPSEVPVDAAAKEGAGSRPTRPLGVPESMASNLTKSQTLATDAAQVAERMKDTEKLQSTYRDQSTTAIPIYNTAAEIYQLASKPYMAPAFAVFEKGDPMGMLGKALEAQDVSSVLKKMRDQITTSRMNSSQKASAMADLQAMELSLGALQTQLQNGVINPTDTRTMFEAAQVPGAKNTQDAFLRGIARIGSDALGRYETNTVFNQFLNRPDADIKEWQRSPEYISLQNNLKRRSSQAITNVAGSEMPKFLKSGLEGAYKYEPPKSSSTKTPSARGDMDARLKAEAAKRGLPTE